MPNQPSNDQILADTMQYIEGRAYLATGSVVSDAETIVRNAVSRGLSAGKSLDDIATDAYAQLARAGFLTRDDVGEATGLDAAALDEQLGTSEDMNLARLNTIVRTNVFDSFNEARLEYFTDPALGGYVEALEYSAILDDNTTEICTEMDSTTWPADDERWNTYSPPLHFNCRSVLIPVVAGDDWQESGDPSVQPQAGFKRKEGS